MKRAAFLVIVIILLAACASAGSPGPAGGTQPSSQTQAGGEVEPTTAGGDEPSLVDAAAKVTDVCTLMPTDHAARLVPGGSAPQSAQYPSRCTVTNQVSVLEITLSMYDNTDPVAGAEQVPGLAVDAYISNPLPDDAWLVVILGRDPGAVLYVEVAGHDAKDHKDDAIAVAQAVIAKLR